MNAQPMAPQQGQAQPGGLPPDFLKLLVQQRVQEKEAEAQREMALRNPMGNPQQPTVAQSLEQQALQSAHTDIMQKLQAMGLAPQVGQTGGAPGGAQMAQAGPQPGMPQGPGGPPAANPPTPMFQGGITRAKSNLPQQYAGGGIVAFESGGYSTEKQMRERMGGDMGADPTAIKRELDAAERDLRTVQDPQARTDLQQYIENLGRQLTALAPAPTGNAAAPSADTQGPNTPQQRYQRLYPRAEANRLNFEGGRGRSNRTSGLPAAAAEYYKSEDKPTARERFVPIAPAPKEAPRLMEDRSGMPEAAPTPPPAQQDTQAADLRKALQGSLIPAMQRDPEAVRRQETERYSTEVGGPRSADMAAQEARIAKMEAMQQAAAANRPGNFMEGLMRMGENQNQRGIGGAFSGVARGITDKQAGYAKEDMANASAMSGLRAAAADAAHQNRAGQYGVGVGAEEKARKGVQDAMGTAERLSATDEQTAMRREVARINALAAQARSGGSEEKGAARKEIVNFIEKIDAELKAARDDFMNPMPPERRKRLEQQRDAAMQALGAMNDLGTTTAAAPSLVGWGEPKVKSK